MSGMYHGRGFTTIGPGETQKTSPLLSPVRDADSPLLHPAGSHAVWRSTTASTAVRPLPPGRQAPLQGVPGPHPHPGATGLTNRQHWKRIRPVWRPATAPPGGDGHLRHRTGDRKKPRGILGREASELRPCAWTRPCGTVCIWCPGDQMKRLMAEASMFAGQRCRATVMNKGTAPPVRPSSDDRGGRGWPPRRTGTGAGGHPGGAGAREEDCTGGDGDLPVPTESFRAREREGRTQARYPGCLVDPRTLYRLPGHSIWFAGPVLSVCQTTSPCNSDEHNRSPRPVRAGARGVERRHAPVFMAARTETTPLYGRVRWCVAARVSVRIDPPSRSPGGTLSPSTQAPLSARLSRVLSAHFLPPRRSRPRSSRPDPAYASGAYSLPAARRPSPAATSPHAFASTRR